MIKKLICYLANHNIDHIRDYKTFIDKDGLMKVSIPKYLFCSRCNKRFLRDIEPYEWGSIVRGSAVVRD